MRDNQRRRVPTTILRDAIALAGLAALAAGVGLTYGLGPALISLGLVFLTAATLSVLASLPSRRE